MPGVTTNGLPYPVGTDRLTDGAAKIQELAEAADTKLLAAWTLFPMTWIGSSGNPNKGAAGTCDLRYLKRGHTVDFAFKLFVSGSGWNLGTGNYSFQTLPFPVLDWDRYSFSCLTQAPNRQYAIRLTSAFNLIMFRYGGTSQFDATQAGTDGWTTGVTVSISGSYESTT